jgi:hypothetical protein
MGTALFVIESLHNTDGTSGETTDVFDFFTASERRTYTVQR